MLAGTRLIYHTLQSLVEGTSWQQDSPTASFTHEANIKPEPDDFPFEAAAGVFLAEPDQVAKLNFVSHGARL